MTRSGDRRLAELGFEEPADRVALRAVQAAFPDREIVQIEVGDLLWGGGGIHCVTQQEPDPGPGRA